MNTAYIKPTEQHLLIRNLLKKDKPRRIRALNLWLPTENTYSSLIGLAFTDGTSKILSGVRSHPISTERRRAKKAVDSSLGRIHINVIVKRKQSKVRWVESSK